MIDIRGVGDDDLVEYLETGATGFLERVDTHALADEVRPLWDLSRHLAAFDGSTMCGTFRSWASELTVPGGAQVAASCIAGVAVLPTHRRRGILRRFIAAEHSAARERGEALTLLYASEYPIYGRMGYGVGTRQATFTLDTRGTSFHPHPTSVGTVEMGVPTHLERDAARDVYDRCRRQRTGELRRRPWSWDFDFGLRPTTWGNDWRGFVALHRDQDGQPDGYARFSVDGRWQDRQPKNVLKVDELHAFSEAVSADLWRFLAGLDWVTSIVAERRIPADPLPWLLTNSRAAVLGDVSDALWVHLVDVPRALEARTFAGEGSLVLDVVDGDERTRVALEVDPDGSRCRPTTRSPDVTVQAAVLGAAYLGGTRLRDAALGLGPAAAEEHRAGALAMLHGWLQTVDDPWCSTFF
jgi:predicted acetyltransferase